jgi:hypothetical protein
VAQPVDECATGAVSVDAGAAKARSTRYCRVPREITFTIGAYEYGRRRRPIPCRGSAVGLWRGTARAVVEMLLDDLDQRGFNRDPAVLAAVPANVNDGTVVTGAKVTDVGAQQFIGAQAGAAR